MLSKWTSNNFLGAIWGFLSGAISQSSSNTAFILVGLVESDLVKVRNALPIISWANVGTTVLIFLVSINMNLAILILLGLSGIFFGFDKGSRREHFFGSIFGISVLLFGFQLLKTGSVPFSEMPFINERFSYTTNSYLLPILVGAVLRFLIHSSSTVTVLIITISHIGLIGIEQVFLMICGMGIGEGATVLLLSSNTKGTAGQITFYKVIESFTGTFIMLILIFFELIFKVNLLLYLTKSVSPVIEQQAAFSFLLVKILPTLIFSFFYDQIYKVLYKLSPPTAEEHLSKLKYLNEHTLIDIETALTLVEKEQTSVIARFPDYLNLIRFDEENNNKIDSALLHSSSNYILKEINSNLKTIARMDISYQSADRYLDIQNRNNYLINIDETLYDFSSAVYKLKNNIILADSISSLVESLHANLLTFAETAKSNDIFDVDILINITDDKSSLMDKLRKNNLGKENLLNNEERANFLHSTDLFQRIIWFVNKWGVLYKNSITDL
mgnify:CR=1 FL=1